jgi:hypothetical protein
LPGHGLTSGLLAFGLEPCGFDARGFLASSRLTLRFQLRGSLSRCLLALGFESRRFDARRFDTRGILASGFLTLRF